MLHIVETKDHLLRIFDYIPFSEGFSDDFKIWCVSREMIFVPMDRRIREIPITLRPRGFTVVDDMHKIPDNQIITHTFYFENAEDAMLFKLAWA